MSAETSKPSVVIVGGGFAGVGCAKELAKHDIAVTLLDRNNYHQFQPLLYQVATAELAHDRRRPAAARHLQASDPSVDVKPAEVDRRRSGHPHGHDRRRPDVHRRLPGAGGRIAAELLPHAGRRGARLPALHRRARRARCAPGCSRSSRTPTPTPARSTEGALNFVIVGAGPTGVETAGAIADAVNDVMPQALPRRRRQPGAGSTSSTTARSCSPRSPTRPTPTPPTSCSTTACSSSSGTGVTEIAADQVTLSDGTRDPDPHRGLGRRHPGARAGRPSSGCRRAGRTGRRAARPHRRGLPARLRHRRHGQHRPTTTATTSRSSARSPCRPGAGRPRTSSPTSTASRASPSTTRTRASWR